MKIKSQPDDFTVEELPGLSATATGDFALYRLEKTGWGTPEALAELRKTWKFSWNQLSHAGLKDKHARTIQYFTILHGPERDLNRDGLQVQYLGRCPRAYEAEDSAGNRFGLILRDLSTPEIEVIQAEIPMVREHGVANYFDDQRFGSVTVDGRFIARELCFGHFEEALKLALTGEVDADPGWRKSEKQQLIHHWGNWSACRQVSTDQEARESFHHLQRHPSDFRGAIRRLRPELSGLYLSAYQSHLWNKMLSRWLEINLPPEDRFLVALKTAPCWMPTRWSTTAAGQRFEAPYPSARLRLMPDDAWAPIITEIMIDEGLTLQEMRVPGERSLFFSKGARDAVVTPKQFSAMDDIDELNPGRRRLQLHFELPRGAYATMVIKRLCRLISA